MKTNRSKIHSFALALATAAGLFLCNSVQASILWDGDASNGTSVFGSLNIENNPGTITVVTDAQQGQVFKMVCFDNGSTKVRTEGSRMRNFQPVAGQTYWFGWKHKWGPLPTLCGKWQVLEQIHLSGTGATGGPVPFGLHVDGCDANMEFEYQDGGGTAHNFLVMAFPPLNSWHSFMYHEKWSESESDGYVEFWYDGTMKTLANGSTRYPSAWCFPNSTSYWKWGIYRSGSGGPIGTSTAYLWRPRAGTTQADVDPLGGTPQTDAPDFSPAAGTYTGARSVTISSTTSGASIRYTTDGSTPTSTTGTLYSGPVAINATTTLKAIAFASGFTDSTVTTGVYTIQVLAPAFSPAAGTYTSVQSVTISTTNSGASIRYTTDGSTPTSTTGTLYSGPVAINVTTTLKAIAFKSGLADSPVTTGVYTINLPQVAAPTFSPVAGTYTNPVSVTISSTTSGASIRYTIDGSTPTSSSGILYTNPVAINVTTTLKAIAFKSGSTDSTVTSALYTINTGGTTVSWEAETLAFTTNGATAALQNDVNTSGGTWLALLADGAGDWIQFTLPNITAGTYQVKLSYKQHVNRGILQASANGANFGATLDQYSATTAYPEVTLGTVTFSSTGNQTLRLTCTGKTAASGAFTLSADKITLVPTSGPPPTVSMEAESLPVTSIGATTSTANDAGASGGVWLALNSDGVGDSMDLTTVVMQPGTYSLQFTFKFNNTRGQHTVLVDGVQVGATIDQYAATTSFTTVTLGNVTFASSGTHTIRLTVTGKNASSSNFILSADKFTFVGQ